MASTYNKEWNNLSIEEKRDVIRVALKNGIRELPDIKAKYNEFAGGGSFYQRHRARWNNYLLRHGVPEQQAAKLSTFFAAQDALESGHGTSDAAKGKNNFGGMQRLDKKSNKMVNISYPSVDAYMDAKWKMMQNRFGRALNANSIQEYSNLLNNPRYHGKGYMYALYEGYRDGKPLDVAKQTQHMNNYTKILMDIAGEKGFKGAPVPAGQAGEAPASIARPENPYTQYTPAEPFFNQNMTFVRPEDVRKAQEENALKMAESQNAAMQQERKQSVDSFNTLMGLLHTPNNGSSGILGTIATLASLNKNNRFDTGGVKQQPRQYIYDVLPSLFAKDGVKITVSSGFRPGAKTVEGKPSRHSLKQAADIVGDFKAIRRVLDDPNSYTSRWLLANGYGYLDETSATGTTKFWHDHKRDHSHYHIGMDSGIVSKYANMMNGRAQNPLPAQQNIVEQPVELAQATPDIPFTPSNPQAFFGVHPAQQQSVYDYVTTPTVEEPVYDPMVEEKNDALSNLSKINAIMQLTSPSNNNNNSFLNTVGLLANMSAEGGKIHIKPENRGKFTALKKRTGHSATWFKEHGTPAQKKMATFALNARHWKHGLGGNLYEEGGPEKKWKALDNIDFVAIPDTSFTRDKTGVGSIEYFDSRYPEGITYPNGYHREHPLPGKDVILYNPNDNDKQDIRLDALHIMPKDATYDTLYSQYLDEIYTGQAGDLAWKGVKKWEDDAKKYGKNNIDTKNQYIRNEADGLLRNSLIEGDSDYRKQKGYSASKSDAVKEFPTLVPYVDAIQNYLVTGERPANILSEVTITGKKRRGKKHGYGGHIYDGTTEDTQQMNIPFEIVGKGQLNPELNYGNITVGGRKGTLLSANYDTNLGRFKYDDGTEEDVQLARNFWTNSKNNNSNSSGNKTLTEIIPQYNWDRDSYLAQQSRIDEEVGNRLPNTDKAITELSNLWNYSKGYLKNKFNGDDSGILLNLADKNVSRIMSHTGDVETILTNDFVENNNNMVRKKKDFINTTDTLLGDKKIPLSKISTFYGIEDGKLKAGPLDIFDDNTVVVPNRAKYVGRIKEYHPMEPSSKEFKEAIQNGIAEYNKSKGYEPDWLSKIIPFSAGATPGGVLYNNLLKEEGKTREGRKRAQERRADIIASIQDKYSYLGKGELPYVITENNDTIRGYELNASPKTLFADENGNAIFVSSPRKHAKELNSYLKEHPMYPIMVDNGRYASYQTDFPNAEVYGGLNRPNNMFIIGTTKKKALGGNIYDGITEDSQQMNIPYAGELPDVTIMPRRIANKAWDKVQERWVGDMPTYYAVNPETGKEEMLREIGNGKYSTYDDKHVFDVLGAEAAKKEREQWIKNGGNASDFDKVILGTLGLGVAPIALPEIAAGALTPAGQTLLAGTLGGEAWEALNQGITGQSWGDNLGDVIGLDKDNYLGRTALGLANPFYGLSPNMVYKGGAAATELGKSLLNAGKNEVQYTARVADNAMDDVLAAASDYPFKYEIGTNDKVDQYLTRRRYSDKIHGKPTKSFLDFDPVTGDFVQNNEKFAPDVVKGLPAHIQEDLMHNTVGRNMDAFINEGITAEEAQAYVDRAKKAMEDVHVGRYSNYDYEKAGYDKTGGFYDDKNNFISVNEGSKFPNGFVEKHEGRHLIDYQADDAVLMPEITGSDYDADKVASLMQRTKQKQNMVLGDAYDNDFLTIPESKFADGLESYPHMSREAVTTNRDARDVLFAKHNFGEQDILLQNKYIDKMSDDEIFDAVSKANGYGRRFIERLKAEDKLTPKKAKQFREAMKYVGAVAAPVGVGLTAAGIASKTSDKK